VPLTAGEIEPIEGLRPHPFHALARAPSSQRAV
jgi:hypothetical protein